MLLSNLSIFWGRAGHVDVAVCQGGSDHCTDQLGMWWELYKTPCNLKAPLRACPQFSGLVLDPGTSRLNPVPEPPKSQPDCLEAHRDYP